MFAAAQPDRMEEIIGAVCADFGCELILQAPARPNHLQPLVASPDNGAVPACQYPHGRLLPQLRQNSRAGPPLLLQCRLGARRR